MDWLVLRVGSRRKDGAVVVLAGLPRAADFVYKFSASTAEEGEEACTA